MNKKTIKTIIILLLFVLIITLLIFKTITNIQTNIQEKPNEPHRCDWKVDVIQNPDGSVSYKYICIKEYGNRSEPLIVDIKI